ncbi:MAG TPA: DUF4956 domain-containing protein [Syntrophomonas sp.]|nr:DUF4956 domain-containing protein [Syntrophomonas sp.]HRW12278.1 DUF4956 domain-containing protein [Syntrophomonas sp.]
MKQDLLQIFQQSSELGWESIVLHIVVAILIAIVIFLSYRLSHSGTIYSEKFNISLVILTILTTTVMTVIGNNIALSLGMVGALSIVRFRTVIKDSRDTVYIFWAIIVGICCGVGHYLVAALGSCAVFIILLVFGKIRNDNRILLIIRAARNIDRKIEAIIFDYFDDKAQLRVKNTTEANVEFIYELTKKVVDKTITREKNITEILYELGSVEYVNLVTQNDEISS